MATQPETNVRKTAADFAGDFPPAKANLWTAVLDFAADLGPKGQAKARAGAAAALFNAGMDHDEASDAVRRLTATGKRVEQTVAAINQLLAQDLAPQVVVDKIEGGFLSQSAEPSTVQSLSLRDEFLGAGPRAKALAAKRDAATQTTSTRASAGDFADDFRTAGRRRSAAGIFLDFAADLGPNGQDKARAEAAAALVNAGMAAAVAVDSVRELTGPGRKVELTVASIKESLKSMAPEAAILTAREDPSLSKRVKGASARVEPVVRGTMPVAAPAQTVSRG